jgi:AraC family transcriptional regulator of adaptative response/methylated-DNA-[protein]-cysteine methyltransferase
MMKMPPQTTMYRALVERDSTFEGVFFVGVRTTGIFCRPTCPARKPKAENVEFFASTNDALYAGYRPCSRCAPLDREKRPPALVQKLTGLVDQANGNRITGAQLTKLGIDPSTARRQFQKYFGMTFQAYVRARRMGRALHQIRKGDSVIGAQIEQGFDSASGFWEAFRQVFGQPPSKAGAVAILQAKWIDTPLGAMVAVADEQHLRLLEFVDRRGLERELLQLRRQTSAVIVPGENAILDNTAVQLREYFDRKRSAFDIPIVTVGTPFEKSVWKQLSLIPSGETRSYSQLAKRVGSPDAVRAVGRANGRNWLTIIVPCHRVIRADGTLCGYGGGIWRKQWLLDHERAMMHGSAGPSANR